MPLDLEKTAALVREKFPGWRPGTVAAKEFDARCREASEGRVSRSNSGVSMNYGVYRQWMEGKRERMYLDQVEVLAAVLGVPITDLLDSRTRDDSYASGVRAGVTLAVSDMQSALNGVALKHLTPADFERLPEPVEGG